VNQLISGMQMNEKGIRERLEFLGVTLSKSRVAVVLKQSTRIDFSNHEIIRALRYELSQEDLIGVAINDDIIILKNVINETDFRSWLSLFEKWIKKYDNRLVIGTGFVVDDLLDMKSSFYYAKKAIEIGQKLQPEKCFYHYEEYQLEISLSQLTSSKEMFHFYHRLIEHDKNGELIKTLEIYIEESGELNKVAQRLFIHRNTLRYRLERILTITGKDPKNMKDVMELYIAKLLNDLT
jgi:carbohydrate diacid regulator